MGKIDINQIRPSDLYIATVLCYYLNNTPNKHIKLGVANSLFDKTVDVGLGTWLLLVTTIGFLAAALGTPLGWSIGSAIRDTWNTNLLRPEDVRKLHLALKYESAAKDLKTRRKTTERISEYLV